MANTIISIATVEHNDDAGFRAWGSEFSGMLASIGLTQAADSGQVNWSTVTRPGTSTYVYEIWTFNDTLQSTAPIWIRFDYGTGTSATVPNIKITIGTGSNGSGTITGQVLAATGLCNGNTGLALSSNTVAYVSHACYNPTYGVLNMAFKKKSTYANSASSIATFSIQRTVDPTTGLPTAVGGSFVTNNGNANGIASSSQSFTFATMYTSSSANNYACIYGNLTNTMVAGVGAAQIFGAKFTHPQEIPIMAFGLVSRSEIGDNTQFPATLLGTTPLNYIAVDSAGFLTHSSATSSSHNFAFLFQ